MYLKTVDMVFIRSSSRFQLVLAELRELKELARLGDRVDQASTKLVSLAKAVLPVQAREQQMS